MEQTIKFTIGSVFQGEGFKRLQQNVQNVNKYTKQSLGVMSQLTSAIGMTNTKYAQAANAVNGLISAISTGNPALIAMLVALTGITLWADNALKKADKLVERCKALEEQSRRNLEAVRGEYLEKINVEMENTLKEMRLISDEFDTMIKLANSYRSALNQIGTSQGNEKIISMQIAKIQRLQETNQNDSGVVAAEEELKIVIEQRKLAELNAKRRIEEVNEDRANAERHIAVIDEEIALLLSENEKLNQEINDVGEVDVELQKKLLEKRKTLDKKYEELCALREKEREQLEQFDHKEKVARQQLNEEYTKTKLEMVKARQQIEEEHNRRAERMAQEEKEREEAAAKKKKEEEERAKKEKELADKEEKARLDGIKAQEEKAKAAKEAADRQRQADYNTGSGYGYGNPEYGHMSTIRQGAANMNQEFRDAIDNGTADAYINRVASANPDAVESAAIRRNMERAVRDEKSSTRYRRSHQSDKGGVRTKWGKEKDAAKAAADAAKNNNKDNGGGGGGGDNGESLEAQRLQTIISKLDKLGLK